VQLAQEFGCSCRKVPLFELIPESNDRTSSITAEETHGVMVENRTTVHCRCVAVWRDHEVRRSITKRSLRRGRQVTAPVPLFQPGSSNCGEAKDCQRLWTVKPMVQLG
jgi:hypothetical protein